MKKFLSIFTAVATVIAMTAGTTNVYAATTESTQKVIVVTKTQKTDSEYKKIASSVISSKGKFNKSFTTIKGFSAELTNSQIATLKKNKDVYAVYPDRPVKANATTSYYYDEEEKIISAPQVWSTTGLKGAGVGVAVIDTGVAPHQDLTANKNRVVAFKDFVNNLTAPYDDNGHGTHVSGIVAGDGYLSNAKYVGVAPQANIIGIKALDKTGGGYTSTVISGIDWAVQNKSQYNIKVINLSLGSEVSDLNDPLYKSAENAWLNGVVVVAAAGNNGQNSAVSAPANDPMIIGVGGATSRGTLDQLDDVAATFSPLPQAINGTTKPDVYAPSTNIISLNSPNGYEATNYPSAIVENNYFVMSGTSMATPTVAGAVALMLQNNPSLTPNQVKDLLMTSAVKTNGINEINVSKAMNVGTVVEKPNLVSIKIDQMLPTSGSTTLTATGTYSDGSTLPISTGATWLSSNTDVATVDSYGTVKFTGASGSVTITVQYNGLSASVSQTVQPVITLTSVRIEKVSTTLTQMQLRAVGVYSDSHTEVLNSGTTWTSSNPDIATVDSYGTVKFAGAAGSVTITVQYNGLSASISHTVPPVITLTGVRIEKVSSALTQMQLRAVGIYSDNHTEVLSSGATWTSNNTAVATVDSYGLVKFTGASGTVTITVQYNGLTASLSHTVYEQPVTLTSIRIEKVSSTRTQMQLRAVGVYSDNHTEVLTSGVTWTSSNTSIATVNSTGLVSYGKKRGYVQISATYNSFKSAVTIKR